MEGTEHTHPEQAHNPVCAHGMQMGRGAVCSRSRRRGSLKPDVSMLRERWERVWKTGRLSVAEVSSLRQMLNPEVKDGIRAVSGSEYTEKK